MPELVASRDAYGETLVELGRKNPNIVVLDADLSESTRTGTFRKVFPERFFNTGVAEQNMINMAAGLAVSGKIAFASTFAIFATGRAWEQIRNTVAVNHLNVKIVASHSGITVGPDGVSHQCLEDVSLMRSIPGMVVLVPADACETAKAVRAAADYDGPVYIRVGRPKTCLVTTLQTSFEIGKAIELKAGKDLYICACGIMVEKSLAAAEILASEGIDAGVLNIHSIKPIDKEKIIAAAQKTGRIVVAEEHSVIGGLGSAVSEVLGENFPVPIKRVGVQDVFGESGDPDLLMKHFGLDPGNIAKEARILMKEPVKTSLR